jgi:DNA-directed RNA polymerase II subunit RPB1
MNLHLPQSLQTENELEQLALVPTQILTPNASKPIASVVQDVAVGVHLISKEGVKVDEKSYYNMICGLSTFVGDKYVGIKKEDDDKERFYTGQNMMSYIIPKGVNLSMKNKLYDDDEGDHNKVVIRNGIVEHGKFDKTIYQAKTVGLIHTTYNEIGQNQTRDLFDDTQKLVCKFLIEHGFSVGVSDLVVKKDTINEINDIRNEAKQQAMELIDKVHNGEFKNTSVRLSNSENFEEQMMSILEAAKNKYENVANKSLGSDKNNRLMDMITSGSKGNATNVTQMVAGLSQQAVDGKRIINGFDDRTLPHFPRFDDTPAARGFVDNSFVKGLAPHELYFHAMGGREGLID